MQQNHQHSMLFRFACRVMKYTLLFAFGIGAVCVLSASLVSLEMAKNLLLLLLPWIGKTLLCLFWLMAGVVLVESVR
jgi:hypothetical protein